MRVFVAGGTGVLGQRLVPQLVAAGHQVTATTTSRAKLDRAERLGATGVVMDGLDPAAVTEAVAAARPDVIVNEMTAISATHAGKPDIKHPDRWFAITNRLRSEGLDHLLAAATAAGVTRFVHQGYAAWNGEPRGGWVKTEDDPLEDMPVSAAILHLEKVVLAAGGGAYAYGGFYGPGTSMAPGEAMMEALRRRKFPLVGDGGGIWSFIHIADAAAATVAALEHGAPGIYNIVDDDPAPVAEWLPVAAQAAGGKPPRHVPRWLGKLVAGDAAVVMMTEIRGASNAKAKRELAWTPEHPSWRQGFAA